MILHSPLASEDSQSVTSGNFYLVAEMQFATEQDLQAALQSEARAEARVDFAKFPPYSGDVWHQAMTREEF